MSEFKIIETQEQLDAILGERLRRERETAAKKYEGWSSPDDIQKLTDDYIKEIDKITEKKEKELTEI